MVLTVAYLCGTPWLANPLIGAVTLLVTYRLASRIYDRTTARLSALLMLGSLQVVFMSSEYMNHTTALLCTMVFMLCYVEMLIHYRKLHAIGWAIAGGLALGALFLITACFAAPPA